MAILKKLKEKLKKIKERGVQKKATARGRRKPAAVGSGNITQTLAAEQLTIEKTKFSHPQIERFRRQMPQELPLGYGRDALVLQVRDPRWLHSFWEVKHDTFEGFKNQLGDEFYRAKRLLRIYDVSSVIFNGANANSYFDIEVHPDARNWYIDTAGPGRSWCADYGLLLPDGRFITILRSNIVHTPLDGPSWITDEEWMIPDDLFARLYGMGFGLGQSSPVGKAWQEKVRTALFSGVLSSPGITSVGSPVKKEIQKKFWMVVDCELIVYGATEPDAKVTVQGKPITLRADGTFTLRFALPDGKQVIPVRGVSSDNSEERMITPIVARETKIG